MWLLKKLPHTIYLEERHIAIDTPGLLMDPKILKYQVYYGKPRAPKETPAKISMELVSRFQSMEVEDMVPLIGSSTLSWAQDLVSRRLEHGV
jgi:hypothetical protein